MNNNYITTLSTNILSNRVHSYVSETQRRIYEIDVMKKKEAKKAFRFYKIFTLNLILVKSSSTRTFAGVWSS